MANVSVADAAQRLGVSVPRIHQRIADGSLRAERIGSQWVVDELSLIRAAEHREPGRPLSSRSVWAVIALAEGDTEAFGALAPVERSRAKARLDGLLALATDASTSEGDVRRIAATLRLKLRNRARLARFRAAAADLPNLRSDLHWESTIDPASSGIASVCVDGYLRADDVAGMSRQYLLVPADDEANVVVRVLPGGQRAYPDSKLLLAADLADWRGPREELRAADLLREIAAAMRAASR